MALALKERLARQASGETQLTFDVTGRDEPQLLNLSLRLIDPDPNQPRKNLGDLGELILSVREHGILNPIIVEQSRLALQLIENLHRKDLHPLEEARASSG